MVLLSLNFLLQVLELSITLQSDNKILIGGHTWGGTVNEFALARYLSDGSLDPDFGDTGMVTTLFPDKNAIGHSIVLQPDNKIILGGHVYTLDNDTDDFALARYHTNGSLDHSFGNEGLVTTSFWQFHHGMAQRFSTTRGW